MNQDSAQKTTPEIKDFYQLNAWKECEALTINVHRKTKKFPKTERFGLTNQIRRSAGSVGANIAEGFGHFHFSNKIRFYRQARGSLTEVQNFLLLSKKLSYLSEESCKELWEQSVTCKKLLNGLIRSVKNHAEKHS